MRDAPAGSPMAPTVHAYTAAMRAATEGGRWVEALEIWDDMQRAGCQPTGEISAEHTHVTSEIASAMCTSVMRLLQSYVLIFCEHDSMWMLSGGLPCL